MAVAAPLTTRRRGSAHDELKHSHEPARKPDVTNRLNPGLVRGPTNAKFMYGDAFDVMMKELGLH